MAPLGIGVTLHRNSPTYTYAMYLYRLERERRSARARIAYTACVRDLIRFRSDETPQGSVSRPCKKDMKASEACVYGRRML